MALLPGAGWHCGGPGAPREKLPFEGQVLSMSCSVALPHTSAQEGLGLL